jgi:hypothetical protein
MRVISKYDWACRDSYAVGSGREISAQVKSFSTEKRRNSIFKSFSLDNGGRVWHTHKKTEDEKSLRVVKESSIIAICTQGVNKEKVFFFQNQEEFDIWCVDQRLIERKVIPKHGLLVFDKKMDKYEKAAFHYDIFGQSCNERLQNFIHNHELPYEVCIPATVNSGKVFLCIPDKEAIAVYDKNYVMVDQSGNLSTCSDSHFWAVYGEYPTTPDCIKNCEPTGERTKVSG